MTTTITTSVLRVTPKTELKSLGGRGKANGAKSPRLTCDGEKGRISGNGRRHTYCARAAGVRVGRVRVRDGGGRKRAYCYGGRNQ